MQLYNASIHKREKRSSDIDLIVVCLQALQELTSVLNNAKYDDNSQAVLITGSDNGTFCSGLDLSYLTTGDIHHAAKTMSAAVMYVYTIIFH